MPGFTLQAQAGPAQEFGQVRVDDGPVVTAELASRLAGGQAGQAVLTSRAPAVKPAGNKMISAGIRRPAASTSEPTASTKIRPTPNNTWSAVIPNPPSLAPKGRPPLASQGRKS